MFAGLRYAVAVASVVSFVAVFLPLAVFTWDVLQDPSCLRFEVSSTATAGDVAMAELTISYCSSVPLRDVKVWIGSRVLTFDYITRGTRTVWVELAPKDIEEGFKAVEFTVGGLYRVFTKLG